MGCSNISPVQTAKGSQFWLPFLFSMLQVLKINFYKVEGLMDFRRIIPHGMRNYGVYLCIVFPNMAYICAYSYYLPIFYSKSISKSLPFLIQFQKS